MTPQEEILFMEINQDWEQGLGLRRGNRHGLTPDMKTAPINGWGRGFGAGRGMGGRR